MDLNNLTDEQLRVLLDYEEKHGFLKYFWESKRVVEFEITKEFYEMLDPETRKKVMEYLIKQNKENN